MVLTPKSRVSGEFAIPDSSNTADAFRMICPIREYDGRGGKSDVRLEKPEVRTGNITLNESEGSINSM